jgi:hypothetical protein
MSRRFLRLATDIRRSIVDRDGFGFRSVRIQQPAGPRQFAYPQTEAKVQAFMRWLQQQINLGILEIVDEQPQTGEPIRRRWQDLYVRAVALRAIADVQKDAKRAGMAGPDVAVEAIFQSRLHLETAELMYRVNFEALKGVTTAMAASIRQELVQGLIEGQGVQVIARRLTQRVEKVGRTRARAIARTELIRTYSEISLNEYERLGIAGVTAEVEWLTAKDNRVCFPKNALVLTRDGWLPIQHCQIGMEVQTRQGWKPIIDVMRRAYAGKLIRVCTEKSTLYATAEHPFWTLEEGWLEGKNLHVGQRLYTSLYQYTDILRLQDFLVSDAARFPAMMQKVAVFLRILRRISMPILPINLKGNTKLWQRKVNAIGAKLRLLKIRNFQGIQRLANNLFRSGLTTKSAVASERAELFCGHLRWADSKSNLTVAAMNQGRGATAFFRTMDSIQATRFIPGFVPERCLASSTGSHLTASHKLMSLVAGKRAIGIPMCDASFHRENIGTAGACFRHWFNFSMHLIAGTTTEARSFFRCGHKLFAAHNTCRDFDFSFVRKIAFTRTISFSTLGIHSLIVTNKNLFTKATSKLKWHILPLMTKFSILYHKLLSIPIDVYDITVDDAQEFFANDVLVHNCSQCKDLAGKIFTIQEARGKIPRHVSCRCRWRPRVISQEQAA